MDTLCPNTSEKLRKTSVAVLTILVKASSEVSEFTGAGLHVYYAVG